MAYLRSTGLNKVSFPAGHVVKQSFLMSEDSSSVSIANSSWVDTGLQIVVVTARSSADSVLKYEFWTGMQWIQTSGEILQMVIQMRDSSSSSYDKNQTITYNSYPSYWKAHSREGGNTGGTVNDYQPCHLQVYCGLESGMGMPAAKSSWAAGDTLYFRMFGMTNGGGSSYVVHGGTSYSITVTEIER